MRKLSSGQAAVSEKRGPYMVLAERAGEESVLPKMAAALPAPQILRIAATQGAHPRYLRILRSGIH